MKRKLKKFLDENKRTKVITVKDIKTLFQLKNKNDTLKFVIANIYFSLEKSSAFFSVGYDGETPEWLHEFLSLDKNTVIETPDHVKLVDDYIKGERVNLFELYKNSLNTDSPVLIETSILSVV